MNALSCDIGAEITRSPQSSLCPRNEAIIAASKVLMASPRMSRKKIASLQTAIPPLVGSLLPEVPVEVASLPVILLRAYQKMVVTDGNRLNRQA